MDLSVFHALLLNVLPDDLLIARLADRVDVIALCPEFTAQEKFFDVR